MTRNNGTYKYKIVTTLVIYPSSGCCIGKNDTTESLSVVVNKPLKPNTPLISIVNAASTPITQTTDGKYTVKATPNGGGSPSYFVFQRNTGSGWATVQGDVNVYDTTYDTFSAAQPLSTSYSYQVMACNDGGCSANSAPKSIQALANQPPVVTLNEPSDGALFRPGTSVSLRAAASDVADGLNDTITSVKFKWKYAGGSEQSINASLSGAYYVANWTPTSLGEDIVLYAQATDSYGGVGNSSTIWVDVRNNTLPQISLAALPAVVINSGSLSLSATASDADGSITKVEFLANGGVFSTDTSAPYSGTWPVPNSSGTYSLTAKAYDNEGGVTGSIVRSVRVTTPPTSSMVAPSGGEQYKISKPVTLLAKATDDTGIASLTFYGRYSNNSSFTIGQGVYSAGACSGGCYVLSWVPTLPDAAFRIWATSVDADGYSTSSAESTVVVNANSAPAVTVSSSQSSATEGQTLTLAASASDSDGTITQVEFFVNGSSLGADTSAPYSRTWVATPGSKSFTARATDDNGDSTESSAVVVNVAELLPPNPPATLKANDQTGNQTFYEDAYQMSWPAVAGATKYQLLEDDVVVVDNNQLSSLRTNKPQGSYHYQVRACNSKGCGGLSSDLTVTVVLTTPVAPSTLVVPSEPQTGTFDVSWPAVSAFPAANSYQLEEKIGGLASSNNWTVVEGPDLLKRQRENPAVGRYAYQVRACNALGCSNAGVQKEVEVIPPYIESGVLACDGACLSLSGIGLNNSGRVIITAIHNPAISTVVDAANLQWVSATQLQVPIVVNSDIYAALFELGVYATFENPNGSKDAIRLYGNHQTAYTSLTDSSPTVGQDGIIYVSMGNAVYAIDPETGENIPGWPFSTGGEVRATPLVDPINNNIYAASLDKNLYAIRPSGIGQWIFNTQGPLYAAPVLDDQRTLYIGSADGWLYAINAENGSTKWNFNAGEPIHESPVLAGDSYGTIYFTTLSGKLHALGRGLLGPDILVWESQDDSLLASDMAVRDWQPLQSHLSQYLRVARLYKALLQPPLSLDKEALTFWTYALVNRASIEEVANAFLSSNTGLQNFPLVQSHVGFVDALYERVFAGQQQPNLTVGGVTYSRQDLIDLLSGGRSRAEIAVLFSNSIQNAAAVDGLLQQSFNYFYVPNGVWTALACDDVDPLKRDCDDDGLPDEWELLFFGDLDSQSGDSDADDDGVSNLAELLAGADPCDNGCSLELVAGSLAPEAMPVVSDVLSQESDQVGASSGQFRVNEAGAATYNMPLAAPAGIAGVAPSMSLNYSSQGGNGLLGQGWSLGGLSTISRCRQTLGQDNNALAITWSEEDRFCLDGQRLLVVEGEYGAPDSRYRAEVDSFALVTANGGSVGHPGYFTVERKDGSFVYYGNTEDSRQSTTDSKTLTWAQNRVEDSVGNAIDFVYYTAGGHRLKEITYANGAAKLAFEYSDRADPQQAFVSGYSFAATQRLDKVVVTEGANEFRHYRLDYYEIPPSFNKTSYLRAITECVVNVCLPETHFDWDFFTSGFDQYSSSSVQLSSQSDRQVTDYRPVDINGDGRMDLVWQEVDYASNGDIDYQLWHYVLAKENGFGAQKTAARSDKDTDTPYKTAVLDYNADGRSDLAYFHRNQGKWVIHLAQPQADGSWQLAESSITDDNLTDSSVRFMDVNGDGLVDAISTNGYQLLEVANAADVTSNRYYQFGPRIPFIVDELEPYDDVPGYSDGNSLYTQVDRYFDPSVSGDFNGDGKLDLVLVDTVAKWRKAGHIPFFSLSEVSYRAYIVSIDGNQLVNLGKFIDHVETEDFGDAGKKRDAPAEQRHGWLAHKLHAGDLNGDGLTDLITERDHNFVYQLSTGAIENDRIVFTAEQSIGTLPEKASPFTADYNHDGASDLMWFDGASIYLRRWLGDTLDEPYLVGTQAGEDKYVRLLADITGDGRLDLVRVTTDRLYTYPAKFDGDSFNVISKVTNGLGAATEVQYGTLVTSDHYARLEITTTDEERCERPSYDNNYTAGWCTDYQVADQGTFYRELNNRWASGLHHSLGKLSPTLEVMAPMQIVVRVSGSAPALDVNDQVNTEAQSHISYYYAEAKAQAAGRGLLGFKRLRSVDEQSGVSTITEYRQDFPYIGFPVKTEVFTSEGHLLSKAENVWSLNGWQTDWPTRAANDGVAVLGPLKPVLEEATETAYALRGNGDIEGEILTTTTTSTVQDDYGNATSIEVSTTGAGETFTQLTENTFPTSETLSFDNGAERGLSSYAQLGRLTDTTVTRTRQLRGEEVTSLRSSSFTYYQSGSNAGLLESETIEPEGVENETLSTTYTYDDYGNKTSATQSIMQDGVPQERSAESEYEDGRYLKLSRNHYGQVTEEVLARNAWGQPTRVQDAAGIISEVQYSAFGKPLVSYSATGAYSISLLGVASSHCPSEAVIQSSTTTAGGGQSLSCLDIVGRVVREASQAFDGSWAYVDTQYDKFGRVQRKSEPHAGSALYWTNFEYDLIGRVLKTSLPGRTLPVGVSYDGFSTTVTNPNGQSKTETKNAAGELVHVIDPRADDISIAGELNYEYDAQGKLRFLTQGVLETELRYDRLGRKTYMSDPDKGAWQYVYNAFGELLEQTDAKLQRVVMVYDDLGRMTSRVDYSAANAAVTSTLWQYNNSTNWVTNTQMASEQTRDVPPGGLMAVTNNEGYRKYVGYDSLARASTTETRFVVDGNTERYFERQTFDSIGRTHQAFDAGGDGTWQDQAIENRYNEYGYLSEVVDAVLFNGAPRQRYYVVKEMDLRGNVTHFMQGNGITTRRDYDPSTGRLKTIRADLLSGYFGDVQDQEYEWDDIGNLMDRYDYSADKNLHEHFEYDDLNRLTSALVAGKTAQTIRYDDAGLGNIVYKSDVGDYLYGSACAANDEDVRPHAVCETSDGISYSYDTNGNMTSDSSGRTLVYSTFDKPTLISKDGHSTGFKYGPGRDRYLRTDVSAQGTEITRYLGSVERISRANGSVEIKRTLLGGVLITNTYDGPVVANKSVRYLHTDHLGSIDTITDEIGNVVEQMSFDAWGQRRNAQDWEALVADALKNFDHSITTRGFTGHEMLDEVGLVHMNGRIYDARLGRFLQADPVIDGVTSTQGYNRYSYVHNNPLRYTDSSGYSIDAGSVIQIIGNVVLIALKLYPAIPYWNAFMSGARVAANGGDFGQIATAAFTSFFMSQAAVALGAGGFGANWETLGFAVMGGITSEINGGQFGHGFISAGVGAVAGAAIGDPGSGWELAGQSLASMVVAGTISEMTGGKFANGAMYAAFSAIVQAATDGFDTVPEDLQDAISDIRSKLGSEFPENVTYSYEDRELTVDLRTSAVIEGRVEGEYLSPLVAQYEPTKDGGHITFYKGYNDPKVIAQPSHWGSRFEQSVDGATGLQNSKLVQVTYSYNKWQTVRHVVLHEFGGHGLGHDGVNDFGRPIEYLADQWARTKMVEFGWSE
ncbi:Ig-like domain-containing protein [Simiduia litorea]